MKNTFTQWACLTILGVTTISGCKTINPGEVGFLVQRGTIKPGILTPGRYHYNPFVSKIRKFTTRITEYSAIMSPPTKMGTEFLLPPFNRIESRGGPRSN